MKKIPITLTLPENLIKDLHIYISKRGVSSFVSDLVKKGLDEKKQTLAEEFRECAQDEERNLELLEWDVCMGDGLNDSNNY